MLTCFSIHKNFNLIDLTMIDPSWSISLYNYRYIICVQIKVSLCSCNFCSLYIKLYIFCYLLRFYQNHTYKSCFSSLYCFVYYNTIFCQSRLMKGKYFILTTKFINQCFFHKLRKRVVIYFSPVDTSVLLLYLRKIILNC